MKSCCFCEGRQSQEWLRLPSWGFHSPGIICRPLHVLLTARAAKKNVCFLWAAGCPVGRKRWNPQPLCWFQILIRKQRWENSQSKTCHHALRGKISDVKQISWNILSTDRARRPTCPSCFLFGDSIIKKHMHVNSANWFGLWFCPFLILGAWADI